jgi:hypothetical protein
VKRHIKKEREKQVMWLSYRGEEEQRKRQMRQKEKCEDRG